MNPTLLIRRLCLLELRRGYAKKAKKPQPVVQKSLDSVTSSLASKGFLRPIKPYTPPDNVAAKVNEICSQLQIKSLSDMDDKFKVLNECFEHFKHDVPNCELHEIDTIDDVIKFYQTAVDTTTPYDALKTMKQLPENLHIQSDYIRFNPETDTMFNGQTAFPKSSTLVTGLKYRKKYPGYTAKKSWP